MTLIFHGTTGEVFDTVYGKIKLKTSNGELLKPAQVGYYFILDVEGRLFYRSSNVVDNDHQLCVQIKLKGELDQKLALFNDIDDIKGDLIVEDFEAILENLNYPDEFWEIKFEDDNLMQYRLFVKTCEGQNYYCHLFIFEYKEYGKQYETVVAESWITQIDSRYDITNVSCIRISDYEVDVLILNEKRKLVHLTVGGLLTEKKFPYSVPISRLEKNYFISSDGHFGIISDSRETSRQIERFSHHPHVGNDFVDILLVPNSDNMKKMVLVMSKMFILYDDGRFSIENIDRPLQSKFSSFLIQDFIFVHCEDSLFMIDLDGNLIQDCVRIETLKGPFTFETPPKISNRKKAVVTIP